MPNRAGDAQELGHQLGCGGQFATDAAISQTGVAKYMARRRARAQTCLVYRAPSAARPPGGQPGKFRGRLTTKGGKNVICREPDCCIQTRSCETLST
jgi:hypothetical protein